ncbi:MAG: hypothetical protein LBT56_05405 [Prevotellaceae bacterium]|jgi:hypothetical protein|nr:hypothetical protein [Prevotellaceae bacterium]
MKSIIEKVEKSINLFVDEFTQSPYLHIVEHSWHAHLYYLMKQYPELANIVTMKNGYKTQLIHKEWPETIASEGTKRGNFDLVVFEPEKITNCSIKEFIGGKIHPQIVIEMGVNYPQEIQSNIFLKTLRN